MSPGEWVAIVSTAAVPITAVITARMARGAQRELRPSDLIARLEATEARLDAALAEHERKIASVTADHEKKMAEAERKIEASAQRERIRDDYAHQLRGHIAAGSPPPPPPWPSGLTA